VSGNDGNINFCARCHEPWPNSPLRRAAVDLGGRCPGLATSELTRLPHSPPNGVNYLWLEFPPAFFLYRHATGSRGAREVGLPGRKRVDNSGVSVSVFRCWKLRDALGDLLCTSWTANAIMATSLSSPEHLVDGRIMDGMDGEFPPSERQIAAVRMLFFSAPAPGNCVVFCRIPDSLELQWGSHCARGMAHYWPVAEV